MGAPVLQCFWKPNFFGNHSFLKKILSLFLKCYKIFLKKNNSYSWEKETHTYIFNIYIFLCGSHKKIIYLYIIYILFKNLLYFFSGESKKNNIYFYICECPHKGSTGSPLSKATWISQPKGHLSISTSKEILWDSQVSPAQSIPSVHAPFSTLSQPFGPCMTAVKLWESLPLDLDLSHWSILKFSKSFIVWLSICSQISYWHFLEELFVHHISWSDLKREHFWGTLNPLL